MESDSQQALTWLAHPDLVLRPHALHDSPSLVNSPEERPSFLGKDHHLAPTSRLLEPPHVASGQNAEDLTLKPELPITGKLMVSV